MRLGSPGQAPPQTEGEGSRRRGAARDQRPGIRGSQLRQGRGGTGRTGDTEAPPPRTSIPAPPHPRGPFPGAASSRGNCCLGSGRQATGLPGMRLGRGGAARTRLPPAGPGRGRLGRRPTGRAAAWDPSGSLSCPGAAARTPPGSWLATQTLRAFPRPADSESAF